MLTHRFHLRRGERLHLVVLVPGLIPENHRDTFPDLGLITAQCGDIRGTGIHQAKVQLWSHCSRRGSMRRDDLGQREKGKPEQSR